MIYFLISWANINKRSSETFSFSVWVPEEVDFVVNLPSKRRFFRRLKSSHIKNCFESGELSATRMTTETSKDKNSERAAHFLAGFFAVIFRLTFSVKVD